MNESPSQPDTIPVLSAGAPHAAETGPSAPRAEPRTGGAADRAEEVDLWWGSYSGWTLWPSTLICIGLTVAITLLAWTCLPRPYVRVTILGLAGAVWLAQLCRWSYRFFSFNYRLTSRRVFRDRGFLYPEMVQMRLAAVARVEVLRTSWEALVHVGRIVLHPKEAAQTPLTLEGVLHPNAVADLMREWCRIATEVTV